MYDGDHSEASHYNALNHFLPYLDKEFIFIVDDWNWDYVRNPTMESISKNNIKIIYQNEIRTTNDNSAIYEPIGSAIPTQKGGV